MPAGNVARRPAAPRTPPQAAVEQRLVLDGECGRAARGLFGVAAGACRYPVPHCGLARKPAAGAVTMSVLLEDLTVCVGDGCANRFADEAGWEGHCPSCLALWDDHAAGEHDPPVDVCLLCR